MYDFIDLTRLTVFINGFIAVVLAFFASVKSIAVGLGLFKSLD